MYTSGVTPILCPCGETYHVTDYPAGAKLRCRACGRLLDVAKLAAASPPASATGGSGLRGERIIRPAKRRSSSGAWRRRWSTVVARVTSILTRRHQSTFPHALGSRSVAPDSFSRLVVALTVAALVLALVLRFTADRNAAGMLLLFLPLWWLAYPWLVVVPASFVKSWRLGLIAIVGAVTCLLGVSRFEFPALASPVAERRALRIVTYNTDRSALLAERIRHDLASWNADVVLLQDCKTVVADSLRAIAPLTVHVTAEFCLATRLPLTSVDTMPSVVRPGTRGVGRFGRAMRYVVEANGVSLPVYSLHLETPRDALWAARHLDFSKLQNSVNWRGMDSRITSQWISRADTALVVAGDFNLPTGSRILSDDWGDLDDAYSVQGLGFGHTMFAGIHRVRIDHVLAPKTLVPQAVRVFSGFPSEHQPVMVDYAWRGALAR